MQLKDFYNELCGRMTADENELNGHWDYIEKQYGAKGRHYHTLNHLESMLAHLAQVHDRIENWDELLWSLFYHDIIYSVTQSDNEYQSALVAEEQLQLLGMQQEKINRVKSLIMTTKKHEVDGNPDSVFFLDADLAILGASASVYDEYALNVRKEFNIYPDFLYNNGRKKVLKHFLEMKRIYKSEYFFALYEKSARLNLIRELNRL